ncbi:MAG TPA: hypothetical protein VFQ61_36550 [Polyangiaceae bacterium]|nr:hypothetical protein [Polyangiaceae bacterium]
MKGRSRETSLLGGLVIAALGPQLACGSEASPQHASAGATDVASGGTKAEGGHSSRGGETSAGGASATSSSRPLYVLANEVSSGDDTISYVSVLESLDIENVDLSRAVEFPGGRATISTYSGWVFAAPPDSGEVHRYRVTERGALEEDGVISFLNYGFDTAILDAWGNTFVSATKAYLHHPSEGTSVIWNPSLMRIEGEVDLGGFELIRPELGDINGGTGVVRGNRLFRTVFWTNWDEEQTSAEQYLAVYDTDSDRLIALHEERRCPGLSNRVSGDEAGNFYFSNWIYNVGETVLRDAPESCVLRLAPGSERLDDFRFQYSRVTQGLQGANFAYLADAQAVMSVFYPERSPVSADSTPISLVSEPAWKVWSVDLEGKSKPVEGLDWMLGAFTPVHLDGRSLLLIPGEDWSIVYVNELVDGKAVPRFEIPGWSYQLLKVQ